MSILLYNINKARFLCYIFYIISITSILLISPYSLSSPENTTKPSINIATVHWPGYTNKDGSGLYLTILKSIFDEKVVTLDISLMPYRRARYSVETLQNDIFLVESEFTRSFTLIYSHIPIDIGNVDYFHSQDTFFSDATSFSGKTLGWVKGYEFQKKISLPESHYNTFHVNDVLQGVKMLTQGRLDYFIDYDEGIKQTAHQNNIDIKNFTFTQGFQEVYLVGFSSDTKGRKLRVMYNNGMKMLFSSGQLENILFEYGVIPQIIDEQQIATILNYYSKLFSQI
ncbi:transporter substrate-binding domain-containing protein [Zooshikella ganghwensis]|uniref:transporter substrate-binding domain-containing protein n=1 Tax=Zooshikella ganghwensis TaxID=202772 RepID=UPI00042A1BC3|nr:transporter substrate-binding domain-containing protein [Zooshikella ganghwensis]